MLVCYKDRVPLAPTADGRYQCPECGKVRSRKYWRARMPDAELRQRARTRKHKHKRKPAPPPVDITGLGPQYREGLQAIMERLLAASRDQELVIEHLESLVADRRDGDQGNTRVDEFNPASLDAAAALVLEVLLTQELANLFGLEPFAKQHLLTALINRLVPPRQPRTVVVPPAVPRG